MANKNNKKGKTSDSKGSNQIIPDLKQEEEAFPELKKAWKEVRWVGFFVFLFVSIPSMAVSTLITKLLSPGEMDAEMGQNLIEIGLKTAPLTLAVMIIIFAHLREWVDSGWASLFLSIFVLVGTTLLLNKQGYEMVKAAWSQASGNVVISFFLNLMLGYLQLYFWWPFVSSLVIGTFGGWATNRIISSI